MCRRVDAARIPVSKAGRTLQHALRDGEDFELLFTVPRTFAARVPSRIARVPVTRIGEVVSRRVGVELMRRDGRIEPITPAGFKHF